MQFEKETFQSPVTIFILYIAAGILIIMGFRAIFPGEVSPLPIFSGDWRLIRGLLDVFALFPALVFSALVVPFGIVSHEEYYTIFSPRLFQRLMSPLITAICAAVLYALLFFLVLPTVQNYEENLRFRGEIYHLAKERAQAHAENGEWIEASQLISICDSAWYDSPELTDLRNEVVIQVETMRFLEGQRTADTVPGERPLSAAVSALPGQREPLDATEALFLSEQALSDSKLFDAHWLAIVAGRIAKAGSPESVRAAQLAARAWNQIESQESTDREKYIHSLYQLKLAGYEAMVSSDWIRAFYIFQELLSRDPYDPDAENFLAASEQGTKEIAFFMDEMELVPGETLSSALFSLPLVQGRDMGRSVLRITNLSAAPDYAYGVGIEYMVFDTNSRLLFTLEAPYAKFLPITLDGHHRVLIMMRALDRHNSSRRWEPEWTAQGPTTLYHPDTAQITLDISYETFIVLSEMRQRLPSMQMGELFDASKMAAEMGYIPQVFEAEILNRLGACMFFLPMTVIAIVIGWRFRPRQRPRYFFVLLLPILPVVFNGMAYIYRIILNNLGITLILAVGFSTALLIFIIILSVVLILSLILLAAQHG